MGLKIKHNHIHQNERTDASSVRLVKVLILKKGLDHKVHRSEFFVLIDKSGDKRESFESILSVHNHIDANTSFCMLCLDDRYRCVSDIVNILKLSALHHKMKNMVVEIGISIIIVDHQHIDIRSSKSKSVGS